MPSRSSAAVAGSTRSAQPTASDVEHRDRDHGVGALGEVAHGGVRGRLVAGDDEQPDRLVRDLVLVGGAGPRVGHPARVRRRGEVERGAVGLGLEAERVGCLGEPRAAAAARARPDQHRPLGCAQPLAERAPGGDERGERVGGRARRRRRVAVGADRDDLRAVSARLAQPEVDDGRAVDDLRRRRRRPRARRRRSSRAAPGRRRGRWRSTRGGRPSARPALAQQRGEAVRDLGRLRAGEGGDDAAAGAAEELLGTVERGVPGDRRRAPRAARERLADPVLRRGGGGTRSVPCRRASRRRPPGGSATARA